MRWSSSSTIMAFLQTQLTTKTCESHTLCIVTVLELSSLCAPLLLKQKPIYMLVLYCQVCCICFDTGGTLVLCGAKDSS